MLSGIQGSKPNSLDVTKISGKCPETEVLIGGIPISCLIDSGSQVSTITEVCYNQHFKPHKSLQECKSWIKLTGANGLDIPILGMIICDVQLQGQTFKDVYILVVKNATNIDFFKKKCSTPGVIGCNILGPFYSEMLSNEMKVTPCFDNSPLLEGFHQYKAHLASCERIEAYIQQKDILGIVKTTPHLTIPADSTINIIGTTSHLANGLDVAVEQLDTLNHPGLIVNPSLSKVTGGRIAVQIHNFSSNDILLKRPMKIAKISICSVLSKNLNIDLTTDFQGIDEVVVSLNEIQHTSVPETVDNLPFHVDLGASLSPSEKKQVLEVLHRYSNIFSHHDADLGFTDTVEHKITTTDDIPVKQPDRRVPPQLVPEVKNILEKWLDAGIIKESNSPFASQMVMVRKKTGEIRICIDFRQLNNKTVKDAFPIPRIEDSIESLCGAKYFCSLDLSQGYLQVKLAEHDSHKTAFRALGSLYEFSRLPFGLSNSPATFQRLMLKCFGKMYQNGLVVYLDDILVYSKSVEEMIQRLITVFEILQKHNLKLKPSKCHFFKEKVQFLGHIVSADGIATDNHKIQAVQHFPQPTTEKQLRQYLGLTSYFRRFIGKYAQIAAPLYDLLGGPKGKSKSKTSLLQNWTDKCSRAFLTLKEHLMKAPILGFPNFSLPFCLEVDVSLEGFGAILTQKQGRNSTVIAYASRRLRNHEKNMTSYSSFKLEFLALHWAITRKFKDYLYGSKFTVKTDNHPLTKILTAKKTAADMSKLADLSEYDFVLDY